MTLTILAFAVAAFGAYFWMRRAVAFADQAPAAVATARAELKPTRYLDTHKLRAIPLHQGRTKVWEFVAPSGACEFGRRAHGRRIEVEIGAELPSHRCGMTECHCHYRPIDDKRGAERRSGDERRDALRLEIRSDRRSTIKPRRHLNTWTDAPMR